MTINLFSNGENVSFTCLIVVVKFLLKIYSAEERSFRFLKIMKFCPEEVITDEVVNDMDNDKYARASQV